jgi:hypothetical protein
MDNIDYIKRLFCAYKCTAESKEIENGVYYCDNCQVDIFLNELESYGLQIVKKENKV